MTKQHEHVTFWKKKKKKKKKKFLIFNIFFLIYYKIISNLQALSNYVLSYIQIPLKEFLDLPFKKKLLVDDL